MQIGKEQVEGYDITHWNFKFFPVHLKAQYNDSFTNIMKPYC